MSVGVLAAGLPLLAFAGCEGSAAGTSEPARAACRMLYGDNPTGDAHMYNGGCIFPRNPQASLDTRRTCADVLRATWGEQVNPNLLCDLT